MTGPAMADKMPRADELRSRAGLEPPQPPTPWTPPKRPKRPKRPSRAERKAAKRQEQQRYEEALRRRAAELEEAHRLFQERARKHAEWHFERLIPMIEEWRLSRHLDYHKPCDESCAETIAAILRSYGYGARAYSDIFSCQYGEESESMEQWHVRIEW